MRRRLLIVVLLPLAAPASAQFRASVTDERCFGAAARDRAAPCRNPRLRSVVHPTPRQARWMPEGRCRRLRRALWPCEFGAPRSVARRTVAVVGDSHVVHWRGALGVAAERRRWRVVEFARVSCPLSAATKFQGRRAEAACRRWRRHVMRWLARRPEVRTVIVSHLAGTGVVRGRGDQFRLQVDGFLAGWRRLPRSVRRVIVIRDTPRRARGTARCVMRAARRARSPGRRCAAPREDVLLADPAAVAARRARSPRVRLLDMTRWFCDPGRCFPVIGGALVHQDTTHQTAVWNATLGPYLLRALDRLLATRRP